MLGRWTVALMIAFAVSAPIAARADDRPLAREEFKAGSRYFEIGDYVHALEHFKMAYIAFEDPAILFNIAQCQRLMNQKTEAVRSYRIYLQKRPDTANRDEIQKIIVTLEDAIKKDNTATALPPMGVEGANNPRVEDKPIEAPAPVVTPAIETASAPPPRQVDDRPIYKKWWLWAIVGGVVVAGVAVGVGVGVAANSHPDFKPTQPEVGPGVSRALVELRF
jgi:tetratricopeptide (TPR) repeat protein